MPTTRPLTTPLTRPIRLGVLISGGGTTMLNFLERIEAGTLNVFKGKNTAHRVTPVEGDADRIIAVFSYYEQPGVMFSEEERVGFYGRAS